MLEQLLSGNHGLPEEKICGLRELRGGIDGQEATGTQPPEPERRINISPRLQPSACQPHIIKPGCPGGLAKVAATVAAAMQIDLQHRTTRRRQRPRL